MHDGGADLDARRAEGDEWPDFSDAALAATATDWLAPVLRSKIDLAALKPDELEAALTALLPWSLKRRLDDKAPTHFAAPSGSSVPIDYQAEEGPKLSIRLQELFGLDRHPSIVGGRVPLVVDSRTRSPVAPVVDARTPEVVLVALIRSAR